MVSSLYHPTVISRGAAHALTSVSGSGLVARLCEVAEKPLTGATCPGRLKAGLSPAPIQGNCTSCLGGRVHGGLTANSQHTRDQSDPANTETSILCVQGILPIGMAGDPPQESVHYTGCSCGSANTRYRSNTMKTKPPAVWPQPDERGNWECSCVSAAETRKTGPAAHTTDR